MPKPQDASRPDAKTSRTSGKSAREATRPGTLLHTSIAHRAYELYEAAGRPDGREVAFWLQAEAEILNR